MHGSGGRSQSDCSTGVIALCSLYLNFCSFLPHVFALVYSDLRGFPPLLTDDASWRTNHSLPTCHACRAQDVLFRGICPGAPAQSSIWKGWAHGQIELPPGTALRDYSAPLLPEPGYWINQSDVAATVLDAGLLESFSMTDLSCATPGPSDVCIGTTLARDWQMSESDGVCKSTAIYLLGRPLSFRATTL